jgi:hypothetical protein
VYAAGCPPLYEPEAFEPLRRNDEVLFDLGLEPVPFPVPPWL